LEVSRSRDVVRPVLPETYRQAESIARGGVRGRDIEDWPVAATALTLQLPIWTEDRDFFGSGFATWTTSTVELYLQNR
jgi:predicted nucleic acid-binding protein